MKKIINKFSAISLVAIMVLALSPSAFADSSGDDALQMALYDAGLDSTQIKMLEIEQDDDSLAYEIEFRDANNNTEYGYEISADCSLILEKSVDYAYKPIKSKKKIGKTKARRIVSNASGISVKTIKKGSCKYEYKRKVGKYEIKFRSGNYKYEYELLAPTGKIVEYEYEYIRTR